MKDIKLFWNDSNGRFQAETVKDREAVRSLGFDTLITIEELDALTFEAGKVGYGVETIGYDVGD